MIRPLVYYPSQLLREISKPVNLIKDADLLKQLVPDMIDTMYHYNGVGLSAIQVGIPIRLFVAQTNFTKSEGVYINPVITQYSKETVTTKEGCLSLPGISEMTTRSRHIRGSYLDRDLNLIEFDSVYGWSPLAIQCFQHEYDHLDGKMFVDGLSATKKMIIKRAMKKVSSR